MAETTYQYSIAADTANAKVARGERSEYDSILFAPVS